MSVDWEAVEAERRAGLSLREIAARHNVSHVTIKKHLDGLKPGKSGKKKGSSVNTAVNQSVNRSVNPVVLPAATNRGAPTIRTDDLVNRILQGIADGYSTAVVCEQAGISRQTLCNWMMADRDLLDRYARAKALCADLYAEQIIEIADDASGDWMIGKRGELVIDREAVQRSHLRMEARKWYAARIAPTKYGDKGSSIVEGADLTPRKRIRVAFVTSDGQVVTPAIRGE